LPQVSPEAFRPCTLFQGNFEKPQVKAAITPKEGLEEMRAGA
jgi:hypothetical protein